MTKVTYVKFHQGLFTPIMGTLGDTLPSQSKTISGLKMYVKGEYLSIRCKNKSGIESEALVPVTNIAVMEVVEEKDNVESSH